MQPPWIPPLEYQLPFVGNFYCDETEARMLTGRDALDARAQVLLEAGPGTVILKQGASGATAFGKGTVVHQPPVVLRDLVDSIGAGDAFDAGCLLGVLEGWPVEKCMRFAATAPASR